MKWHPVIVARNMSEIARSPVMQKLPQNGLINRLPDYVSPADFEYLINPETSKQDSKNK